MQIENTVVIRQSVEGQQVVPHNHQGYENEGTPSLTQCPDLRRRSYRTNRPPGRLSGVSAHSEWTQRDREGRLVAGIVLPEEIIKVGGNWKK